METDRWNGKKTQAGDEGRQSSSVSRKGAIETVPDQTGAGAVVMEVFKTFTLEAAHRLPHVPPGHKCARLHGHTFSIEIRVRGEVAADSGWVQDFADLERAFQPLLQQLDHACLNDIEGLENPTSENLARWVWARLQPVLPGLRRITVQENLTSGCTLGGE